MKTGIVWMAGLTLMAGAAFADCRARINLQESNLAVAKDMSGTAEKRQQQTQQRFKLSMDARVADGTTYVVFANDSAVGTITILAGDGELELNNNNGKVLPAGANPACSVNAVRVQDSAGNVVLSGTF